MTIFVETHTLKRHLLSLHTATGWTPLGKVERKREGERERGGGRGRRKDG